MDQTFCRPLRRCGSESEVKLLDIHKVVSVVILLNGRLYHVVMFSCTILIKKYTTSSVALRKVGALEHAHDGVAHQHHHE